MIYTIGHSNHELARFLELLRVHAIDVVGDVRSVPYSRRHPQFSLKELERSLREAGVGYVFLGAALGARPGDSACYEGDRAKHALIARSDAFRAALARVERIAEKERIALMCAERDPLQCHRSVLVCRHLPVPTAHILADGTLESRAAFERRMAGEPAMPLLEDDRAHVARAYDATSSRLEYVRRPTDSGRDPTSGR